jgi:hypothetical protein
MDGENKRITIHSRFFYTLDKIPFGKERKCFRDLRF